MSSANALNLDWSKILLFGEELSLNQTERVADDNFTFDENGRQFSERYKTLGKGEIAHYEQFPPFPTVFSKTCNADTQKQGPLQERVKQCTKHHNFRLFKIETTCKQINNAAKIIRFVSERMTNFVGKGENTGYQHFLLFLQCFPSFSNQISI